MVIPGTDCAGQWRGIGGPRFVLAAVAVKRRGIGTEELADVVGREAGVVTWWCQKESDRRQADGGFLEQNEELDRCLAEVGTA